MFCNVVEDNFFMVGVFYGLGEVDVVINVGVLGLGVVKEVLENFYVIIFIEVVEVVKKMVFKIICVGELIG